jgi:hypothetical protein
MNGQPEQASIGLGWIILLVILHILFNPIPGPIDDVAVAAIGGYRGGQVRSASDGRKMGRFWRYFTQLADNWGRNIPFHFAWSPLGALDYEVNENREVCLFQTSLSYQFLIVAAPKAFYFQWPRLSDEETPHPSN